MQMRNKSLILS